MCNNNQDQTNSACSSETRRPPAGHWVGAFHCGNPPDARPHSRSGVNSSGVHQERVQRILREGLSNWEFPPQGFADRMCPPGVQLPTKETIDELFCFPNTPLNRPKKDGEAASVLNTCVKIGKKIIRDHRIVPKTAVLWCDSLVFIPWVRPTRRRNFSETRPP